MSENSQNNPLSFPVIGGVFSLQTWVSGRSIASAVRPNSWRGTD